AAATRAFAALDEKAADTQRMFGAARDTIATLDQMRTDSDALIARYTARLEERVEGALRSFDSRLAEMESRLVQRVRWRADETAAAALESIGREAREGAEAVRAARIDTVASAERLEANLQRERHEATEVIGRLEEMLGEAEAVIGAAELAGDGEEPV